MKRIKMAAVATLVTVVLSCGVAAPALAADKHGGYCGYRSASSSLDATCTLTVNTHTTAGSVTLQWHGLSGGSMKLTMDGPNGYRCNLDTSSAAAQSRTCANVPAGTLKLRAHKQNNTTVYIGVAW